jgi:hypothetical protein
MMNENKNQKRRCEFDGHPVDLDKPSIFALSLLMALFLHLLIGEQLAEVDCTICICNLAKVFEFECFIFNLENTLGINSFCTSWYSGRRVTFF